MLKASTPVTVLVLSVLAGLEKPSYVQMAIVGLICLGVMMSTAGELRFSMLGFIFQSCGILAEGSRLVLNERLLKDLKLDSLSTLYYVAPPSFVLITIGFLFFESDGFPWEKLTGDFGLVLVLNGLVAFFLNIASVLLITNTSALTLTLGGIVKDVMLVCLSWLVFQAPLSLLQVFGYSVSLFALNAHKDFKSNPTTFLANVSNALSMFTFCIGRCKKQRYTPVPFSATDSGTDLDALGTQIEMATSKDEEGDQRSQDAVLSQSGHDEKLSKRSSSTDTNRQNVFKV